MNDDDLTCPIEKNDGEIFRCVCAFWVLQPEGDDSLRGDEVIAFF